MTLRPHMGRHRQAGFTLLELVLVMFVIGIIMAIAFPKFRNLGGGDIRMESRALIGQIQALYGEATFTRRKHRLVLDMDEQRYWAEVQTGDDAYAAVEANFLKPKQLPDGIRIDDVLVAGRGKLSMGRGYIYFFPLGRVDYSLIHLSRGGKNPMTLALNPITGRVTVHSVYLDTAGG